MKIYTIYKTTNTITNKSYIGYSSDWKSRRRLHKLNSKKNNKNYIFYNSIRKHGFENFVWESIYQSLDKQHTLEVMEQYFINEYCTMWPHGYNMKFGGSGGNLSDQAKKKISEKRKGIIFSDEHIKNLSISHLGKKHTEEQKIKISNSLKGKKKNLKLVTCPHCNKSGKGSNMTRYHFTKCKDLVL